MASTAMRLIAGILFGLWLAGTNTNCAAQTPSEDQPLVLAHYVGGEVSTSHVESWARYQKGKAADGLGAVNSWEEFARDPQALETIAVQLFLAESADHRGLRQQTETRMAIWWFEVSQLEAQLRRTLAAQIEIPSATLEAAFEENKARFDRPKRARLRNLFKRSPRDAESGSRELLRQRVEEIRQQVLAGTDFGDLARTESDSQSRSRGGLIGWIKPGQLDEAIERIAWQLEAGQVSEVIESPDGFTLLYLEQKEEASSADPRQVRDKLLRRLKRRKLLDQLGELRRNALAEAHIDLTALDRSGTSPAVPVLRMSGGLNLGAAEVKALTGRLERDSQEPAESLRSKIEEIAYRYIAAREARKMALDKGLKMAGRLEWGQRAILVSRETLRRVEERFEPLKQQEVRVFFEKHQQRYRQPIAYRLGLIRRLAGSGETRQRYEELERLLASLRAGDVTFEDAARAHSDLPSAARGGITGWLNAKQIGGLGPAVSRAFGELSEGEVSDLIQQSEGLRGDSSLWILSWRDTRPPRARSLEEARQQVENDLGNKRVQELQAVLYEEVREQLKLRLVHEAIAD